MCVKTVKSSPHQQELKLFETLVKYSTKSFHYIKEDLQLMMYEIITYSMDAHPKGIMHQWFIV